MEKIVFEKIDPLVDDIADELGELLESDAFKLVKAKLMELSREIHECSISLDMNLQVFDAKREQSLPLLQTGLATNGGNPPYQAWGDSSLERYIVDGEMAIVPHDRCPRCWDRWDFKMNSKVCTGCGARLGVDAKVLLDSDRCPHCESGTVTATNPTCSECGFAVDPDMVAWG